MAKPIDNLKKIRLEKLEKIRELGINPYPARSKRKENISEALEMMDKKVSVAGRIMAIRGHGAIRFFDIRDLSGSIQAVFKKGEISSEDEDLLDLLDMGDFICGQGVVFKTKSGEISVLVSGFQLLTKALLPLPSSWHGLKDMEERYRKRYLDLIMNEDVKKVFQIRSKVIEAHREFLHKEGYIEVETPVLQPLYGGGLARPFKTYHNALGIPLYMRISTELYLKRLIVGGFEKVFEIGKVFRNEGTDRQHNPEFTLLETMEAYADYKKNMDLVEEMTEFVVKKVFGKTKVNYQGKEIDFKRPWKRITMNEAVKQETGIDFMEISSLKEAVEKANSLGVRLDNHISSSKGLILAAVFEEKVEKNLIQPTIIYDFPVETAPLAKRSKENEEIVERFEHYVCAMEASNNYSELNDPIELSKRFKDERKKERLGDEEAHQTDDDFIEAMEYGMPPTSGIGPCMDRLIMILADVPSIRDIILFPTLRPESEEIKTEEKVEAKESKMIKREEALKFLEKKVDNKNIIKHMLATEVLMGGVWDALKGRGDLDLGGTKSEWMMAGLLHDGDYIGETGMESQGVLVSQWLKEEGHDIPDNVAYAMAAHNPETGVKPKSFMDWAIFTGDSLTGLIVAAALVSPSRKLADLSVESVLKRFKEKSFAKGTRREGIGLCKDKLGIELEEFIKISLKSMQGISKELGL